MASTLNAPLASVTSTLLLTGRYSDLTIKCQTKTFKVHRNIVCTQSKPFAATVDSGFKESITGVIDMSHSEPEIVEKFIAFLYEGDYSDGRIDGVTEAVPTPTTSPHSKCDKRKRQQSHSPQLPISDTTNGESLLVNAKLYVIADQYLVQPLKQLAAKKYGDGIAHGWNSAFFVASLKLLYEETPENDRLLKDLAIKAAGGHANELTDRGEFASLCKENGEIAFDVLKASVVKPTKGRCPHCGSTNVIVTRIFNLYCADCEDTFDLPSRVM